MTTRRQGWAYAALLLLLGTALGASGTPAPLYSVYADAWGFAPITTTVVFAVYAVGALAAVLVTGSISDHYGRRPVLFVALTLIVAGLIVFMTAGGVPALIVARALHGLGVGAVVVVASAALLDLRPLEGSRTGKLTGVTFNVGIAIAILVSAVIADHGPWPLVTPYAVLLVVVLGLFVAVVVMHETHVDHRAPALAVARPRVPAEIRSSFRFAALGVMAAWSVLGVFLSLFPALASRAIGADHVLYGGAVVAVSAGAAAVSQLMSTRWDARRAAIVGDIGTGAFLVLAVPAVASGSGWLIALDAAAMGFFHGLAFGCSLRHLTEHVPAGHRGEVMSAFYVLAYGAMAVPTVLAGWAATVWSPEAIFAPFMISVAVACLTAAALGVRAESATAPRAHALP